MSEVIINGSNEAECYFYYKGECRCELNCIDLYKNETITELATRTPEHNYMECKPSDNCYFKQLQRAKAELEELKKYKRYKFLFEKAKEMKEQTDKWAKECLKENEDLKDSLKRTVCQAECYKHKEAEKYKAENEKLKKQHYETLKMLKHEYDGRRRDNEQWFTRCTENHNEDSKIIEKYSKALEEIKNNCVEILATIAEEGKPNHSIVDTIWCKNIPCCTLWELVEGMQREINEVLDEN